MLRLTETKHEVMRIGVMAAQQTLTLYVRVRILHPLPVEKASELQWFRGFLCSLSVFAEF